MFGVRGPVRLTGEASAPRTESHQGEALPLLTATLSQGLQLQIQTLQVSNHRLSVHNYTHVEKSNLEDVCV